MDLFGEGIEVMGHFLPVTKQGGGRAINVQNVAQTLFLEHQWYVVDVRYIVRGHDRFRFDMAKRRQFIPRLIVERCRGSANEDIGGNAQATQFFHGVLGWFRLLLSNRSKNRHERDMDKGHIFTTDTELELAECFNIG